MTKREPHEVYALAQTAYRLGAKVYIWSTADMEVRVDDVVIGVLTNALREDFSSWRTNQERTKSWAKRGWPVDFPVKYKRDK